MLLGKTYRIKHAFDQAQTDKGYGHHYHHMYASIFAAITPRSILEIGVSGGHSINAWRNLFPDAKLTGLDYKQRNLDSIQDFEYIIGDSTNPDVAKSIDKYDIIIDDGSHHVFDQLLTFNNFKDKFNYFYIIEDIGWQHKREDVQGVLNTLKSCIIYTGFRGIATFDSHNNDHECYSLVVHAKDL